MPYIVEIPYEDSERFHMPSELTRWRQRVLGSQSRPGIRATEEEMVRIKRAGEISSVFARGTRTLSREEIPEDCVLSIFPERLKSFAPTWCVHSGAIVINQSVKDVLDRIEPDTHQIVPIDVTFRDGTPAEGNYYFLNVTQTIDSIIDERSTVAIKTDPFPGTRDYMEIRWSNQKEHRLTFDPAVTAGRHLWREKRYSTPEIKYAMSDALHDAFEAAGAPFFTSWKANERLYDS
ncbi:imm11 family protein [Yoonia sp. I 8.24]|uniref:imm11 family protein n=1 Tax=Yoonia sp. I 8.24 TaxID=1537229 RepID=UPI001EDEC07F|nr:DUF1629 domain-containing protein [Yoonia sp. I 8.24]MCG3268912.1 hypothetical protein [Yoonia sp. I 8.24]